MINIGGLYVSLVVIGNIVGIALIWLMVELILTVRRGRRECGDIVKGTRYLIRHKGMPLTIINGDVELERDDDGK